jgi:hypothetical protein
MVRLLLIMQELSKWISYTLNNTNCRIWVEQGRPRRRLKSVMIYILGGIPCANGLVILWSNYK